MKLRELTLKDSQVFEEFLGLNRHELSVYGFANIYIWKALFCVQWAIVEDNLCVFLQDKIGAFLYLSPLGKKKSPKAIEEVFKVLNKCNKNKEVSRIENAEACDVDFYQGLGYVCKLKSSDYVCLREDLAGLRGNRFKSKRASYNYFVKHYEAKYEVFLPAHADECIKLYRLWWEQRLSISTDACYQGMLADSFKSVSLLLKDYPKLNLIGRIVKIDGRIKALTFGFPLNNDTFCILYEITDLTIKGLAQFIFCKLCQELKDYKYVNIMDDSGLENLRQVKLSYHPVKLAPAYAVTIRNGHTY